MKKTDELEKNKCKKNRKSIYLDIKITILANR